MRVPSHVFRTKAGLRALLPNLLWVIAASTHGPSFVLASHLRRICSAIAGRPSSCFSSRSQRMLHIKNADPETSIRNNRAAPGCILPLSSLNSARPHPRIVPSFIVGQVGHFSNHTFLHGFHTSVLSEAAHSVRMCSIGSTGRPARTGHHALSTYVGSGVFVRYAPALNAP